MIGSSHRYGGMTALACSAGIVAVPCASRAALTVCMPLDYTAFCLMNQESYLRYARERLVDPQVAEATVKSALGELATIWPTALRSASTAAVAWRTMAAYVSRARTICTPAVRGALDCLHSILPALQADVLILHRQLALSIEETADLMGIEEPTVACYLLTAERRLTPPA